MNRAHIAIVVLAGVLAGVGVAYFMRDRVAPSPPLERATLFAEPRALPAFELIDQERIPFGPERLRGRWTLLFFGFVNCPDVCPTTLATLAEVRRKVASESAGDVPQVVLVSVDPGRDTPPVLAQYVAHFDPSFTGVTGDPAAIETLTQRARRRRLHRSARRGRQLRRRPHGCDIPRRPRGPHCRAVQHAARGRDDRARLPEHRRGRMRGGP